MTTSTTTMTATSTLPAGTPTLTLPGAAGTSRTAARPVRLRLRRGQRRHRLEGHRRQHHQRRRGQRHRRLTRRRLEAGDVRPVGLRRQDRRPAVALRDRRRRRATAPTRPPVSSSTTSRSPTARHAVHVDGAETSPNGWTLAGFTAVGGHGHARRTTTSTSRPTATYVSFDKYLQTGPYNFGFPDTKPDFVEHFPYQNGLLVSYWDTSQSRQQREPAPGRGPDPAGRREPAPIVQLDGTLVASAGQRVRRAVRPGEVRLVHAARRTAGAELHPWPGGPAAVPRQRVVLGRLAADGERQGAEQRAQHQGAEHQTAPRWTSRSRSASDLRQ